jgi:beta-galactosidase/beta-glucuronidase
MSGRCRKRELVMRRIVCWIGLGILLTGVAAGGPEAPDQDAVWAPVEGRILTRWAADVTPENVHPEYPRPQMVRESWMNLNGLWEYRVLPKEAAHPQEYSGTILVPFPIESALSGVGKTVGEGDRLWYRRTFRRPRDWGRKRVLLNFEAVDWETTVWVNGLKVGSHRGGYDPFSFDITPALKKRGEQEIVLAVWDPTDDAAQPRGKQVRNPRGIWYTAVTGIWRTVWLEPVNDLHIRSLHITPDPANEQVLVRAECGGEATACGIVVEALQGEVLAAINGGRPGRGVRLSLKNVRLWDPENPYLYGLRIKLEDGYGRDVDLVQSYFGMRSVSVAPDAEGVNRLFLNGRPLFHFGPLDQGWWPDGLYTAASDEALRYDLEATKELGFNMLRKHVKIEPRRFYYWCDRLGVLVWQDMPSGDAYIGRSGEDIVRSPQSEEQFMFEMQRMIETLYSHPSIVMWVPFNEGWGQFKTAEVVDAIQKIDPTRLVDNASGWADRSVGDVHDVHAYPGPDAPPNDPGRAAVLGEFGGLGLPLAGHTWQEEKNWGYRSFTSPEELTAAYLDLLQKLMPLIDQGLAAAVYTQTSDVEIEVNGLLTYDRELIKMDRERVAEANLAVIQRLKRR